MSPAARYRAGTRAAGEARRRVLAQIDGAWERELEFLRGLVTRPSTLGDEAPAQRLVAAELTGIGLDVDIWEIDHAQCR
jgi:acetylornithine deacetylase/succinyl-diaminopimelate desuccinylase-like protein